MDVVQVKLGSVQVTAYTRETSWALGWNLVVCHKIKQQKRTEN